jgi:hypothetical protein
MRTCVSTFVAMALLSTAFAVGCASNEKASEDTAEDRTTEGDAQQTDEETSQERAEARKGSKDGKKGKRGKGKKGKARAQEATLELNGDSGTEFSGSCTVGDEETEVSGQVPESFSYELDGERLECEISKESAEDDLEVVFAAGNNVNSVQRISGGTLKFTYENGRLSSSTSSGSSGSSSSSSQVVSSSQSGSSSSSVISSP